MERKKTLLRIKLIFYVGFGVVLAAALVLEVWSQLTDRNLGTSLYLYWATLVGWLMAKIKFRLNSSQTMRFSFVLTLVAFCFVIIGLQVIGEVVMRIGFIGWLLGIAQAFWQNRIRDKNVFT